MYRLKHIPTGYAECRGHYNQVVAETNVSDWIIEEIKHNTRLI